MTASPQRHGPPPSSREPLALARALLRCPSVTPASAEALALIDEWLGPAGFVVERVTFSEPGTPNVDNLYARYGRGRPHLVFAGHVDVVPPGDLARWTHDPFGGEVADGLLHGRGACDMKGAVACMVAAALRFVAQRPRFDGSIGFLITGDEEGPAINGTVKLIEWAQARGERFDACILGEPTNPAALGDMLKIGRRGSLTGHLVVHGRQGHVGYPHLADNPIRSMIRLLNALTGEPLDSGSAHFEPSNLEVTTVDVGNRVANVIPAEARATFNLRFNDRWNPASLELELRRRLDAAADRAAYELTVEPTNAVAFLTEPGPLVDLVSAAVEAVTERRPKLSTAGGTSDARFIKAYCPVVEFGLVGRSMHQIDESVPVADLERLTAIYYNVLARYFPMQ